MSLNSTDLFRASLIQGDMMANNLGAGIDGAFAARRQEKERQRLEAEAEKAIALKALESGLLSQDELQSMAAPDAALLGRSRAGERNTTKYNMDVEGEQARLAGLQADTGYKTALAEGAKVDTAAAQRRAEREPTENARRDKLAEIELEIATLEKAAKRSGLVASGMVVLEDGKPVSIDELSPKQAEQTLTEAVNKRKAIVENIWAPLTDEKKQDAGYSVVKQMSGVENFIHPGSKGGERSKEFKKFLKENKLPSNASYADIAAKLYPDQYTAAVQQEMARQVDMRNSIYAPDLSIYEGRIATIGRYFPYLDTGGLVMPEAAASALPPNNPADGYSGAQQEAEAAKARAEATRQSRREEIARNSLMLPTMGAAWFQDRTNYQPATTAPLTMPVDNGEAEAAQRQRAADTLAPPARMQPARPTETRQNAINTLLTPPHVARAREAERLRRSLTGE